MNQIILQPLEVICARHGEVFRPRWPLGYPDFTVLAFQALMEDASFLGKCAEVHADPEFNLATEEDAIRYMLTQQPLCCRLGADRLLSVYREVNALHNVWEARHCGLCERHRPGCTYRRMPNTLFVRVNGPSHKHVCLRCVTHGQDGR